MVVNLGSLADTLNKDAPTLEQTFRTRFEGQREDIVKALKENRKFTLQVGGKKLVIVPDTPKKT